MISNALHSAAGPVVLSACAALLELSVEKRLQKIYAVLSTAGLLELSVNRFGEVAVEDTHSCCCILQ
jgi:hypothetical protein